MGDYISSLFPGNKNDIFVIYIDRMWWNEVLRVRHDNQTKNYVSPNRFWMLLFLNFNFLVAQKRKQNLQMTNLIFQPYVPVANEWMFRWVSAKKTYWSYVFLALTHPFEMAGNELIKWGRLFVMFHTETLLWFTYNLVIPISIFPDAPT